MQFRQRVRRVVQMRLHVAHQCFDAWIGIRALAGLQRRRRAKIHRGLRLPQRQQHRRAGQQHGASLLPRLGSPCFGPALHQSHLSRHAKLLVRLIRCVMLAVCGHERQNRATPAYNLQTMRGQGHAYS
jgi:hypothetical protein